MEITYGLLKKALDKTVNDGLTLQEDVPVEFHLKSLVVGKLMIPKFLNECADYCSNCEAIDYYKASLLLDPFQKDLWGKMALNFHLAGKNRKALKYIEKALEIDKGTISYLELKQSILIDLRRFSEALFLFEQIEALNSKSATAYFNRGKALVELGYYEKAIASLVKAIELDPEEKEIPFHLAKIYRFHLLDETLAEKYEALAGLIS